MGDKDFTPQETLSALTDAMKLDSRLDGSAITAELLDGVVTLRGRVATAAEKSAVESTARGIPGVLAVSNDLRIQPGRPDIAANAPALKPN
jgi:osmotically-inducible protein OsmY